MAATYTLANAITEICNKVGDYDEYKFGANDPDQHYRAKKLFWEAVYDILSPSEILKEKYPLIYAYATGITPDDIFGLCTSEAIAIASGIITLTALTGDFYRLLYPNDLLKSVFTDPNVTGSCQLLLKLATTQILAGMKGSENVPAHVLYIYEENQIIKVMPKATTTKLTVLYITQPDNTIATTATLHTIYSPKFIKTAEQLATLYLKEEIVTEQVEG